MSLPRFTYGSRGIAWMRYRGLPEGPAREAALGRYYAVTGAAVPQRGLLSPAAVAWHREAAQRGPGGAAGYMNRHERRRLTRRRGVATVAV